MYGSISSLWEAQTINAKLGYLTENPSPLSVLFTFLKLILNI